MGIFTTIAVSMVSLATLVLTITMVVLAEQLRRLTEAIRNTDRDSADRAMGRQPDSQGIGVAVNGATSPHP